MKSTINLKWIGKNIEEIIASVAIALMLVICSCNVFARYIFRSAISWADEVNICLLAWATFVGSAAAYKRNLHYGMDFLMDRLPRNGRRLLRILIIVIIMITCAYLAWQSLLFTMKAVKVMPFSRLSYKWIDASAVIGFASMTLHSAYYLLLAFIRPVAFEERYLVDDLEEGEEEGK